MKRQWTIVGIVVGLIAMAIGLGWVMRDRFQMVEVGSVAPDVYATDLEGSPVRLADLAGEVVLLNIWATWCAPCREEMPSMQRLYEKLGPAGLRIVAVSVDAPQGRVDRYGYAGGDVGAFARELDLAFTIWHEPTGRIQRTYWATGVP